MKPNSSVCLFLLFSFLLCSCTARPVEIIGAPAVTSEITSESEETAVPSDTEKENISSSESVSVYNIAEPNDSIHIVDVNRLNYPSYIYWTYINENTLGGVVYNIGFDELLIYDIHSDEFASVPFNEGFHIDDVIEGKDGDLCRVISSDYRWDDDGVITSVSYNVANVHKDYDTEIIENCTKDAFSFDFNGHKLCNWDGDIYDLTDGENQIVKGEKPENIDSLYYRSVKYLFPVDKNSFVYGIYGYECNPGFGIYDYTMGKSTPVPDSEDTYAFGAADGQIFSFDSYWDGVDGKILYSTDAKTLEKTEYMTLIEENESGYVENYSMSPDGKYIAASLVINENREVWIIERESKKIISKYNMGDRAFSSALTFMDDDTFFSYLSDNNLAIIDIENQ